MIRTKVLWLEQAAPQWEEVIEQDAEQCVNRRMAELAAWQCEEQRTLPMPADLILWLEDRGYVVDLLTGYTSRLEPLQQLIDEALELTPPPTREARAEEAAAQFEFECYYRWCQAETADLRDAIDEADWNRGGC